MPLLRYRGLTRDRNHSHPDRCGGRLRRAACGRWRQPHRAARATARDHRSERRRQDHLVQCHYRRDSADRRPHRVRWYRTSPGCRRIAARARHFAHLPDHQPVPDPDSVQDNMVLAVRGLSPRKFSLFGSPDTDARAKMSGSPRARTPPRCIIGSMSWSRNCPTASSASSKSRSHWSPIRSLLLLDEPAAGSVSGRALDRCRDHQGAAARADIGADRARHGFGAWPCRFRHLPARGARAGRGISGRDPPQQEGAGSLSRDAAPCLRSATCRAYYGDAHVIHGVSLDVGAGEVVALLGRNGMGKTTIIRSIMGLSPPQVRSGSVRWKGEELLGKRPHAHRHAARSRSCRRAAACFRR